MCACEIKEAGRVLKIINREGVGFRELLTAGRLFDQQSNDTECNSVSTFL